MARKILTALDLTQNEVQNAVVQVLASAPGSPVQGQIYYNSTTKTFEFYTGTAWRVLGTLDQITAAAADVALGTHKITGLGDPSAAQDAATKNYVDNTVNGLDWKTPVRFKTTANVSLSGGGLANGTSHDGVTAVTGDRVLVGSQTAPAENGIYVVPASGAASRSTDADSAAEVLQLAVAVEEGTAAADTFWVNTTNAPITLNTTGLTFAQWGAGATYTAGTGLQLSANAFAIEGVSNILLPVHGGTGVASPTAHAVLVGEGASAVTPVGPGTTGQVLRGATGADPAFGQVVLTTDVTGTLPIGNGGTGGATAAAARAALAVTTKYSASLGDGATTSFPITHSLGTTDVIVQVHRVASPFDVVEPDIQITDTNNVTLVFASAPSTNQYRINVIG